MTALIILITTAIVACILVLHFLGNPVVSRSSFDEDGNEVNL